MLLRLLGYYCKLFKEFSVRCNLELLKLLLISKFSMTSTVICMHHMNPHTSKKESIAFGANVTKSYSMGMW